MAEKLGLSYKNMRELNKIIDDELPGRPRFRREEIVIAGEAFDIYFRDVIECSPLSSTTVMLNVALSTASTMRCIPESGGGVLK